MKDPPPTPLVSIIIPSYNQGRFIRKTIESCLEQDYRPIEILVVDGASTDETVEVLRSFGNIPELTWVSEKDRGVVEAVNKGFARASGAIAAIQSSDDYYLPGAIRAGVEALEADPSLGFVFGDIVKVDAAGRETSRTRLAPYSLEAILSMTTWIPQPSTFFRLPLAKSLGGWREEVPYAADTDLWYRIALRTGARKLDRLMAARRLHEAQRDRHGDRIIRDYTRMIATLPGLAAASGPVRSAARAGVLMIRNRYGKDEGSWTRWWRTCRACCASPVLRRHLGPGAVVPGAWMPRAVLRRLLRGKGVRNP